MVESNDGDGDVSVLQGEAMRNYICGLSFIPSSRGPFTPYRWPKALLLGGAPFGDFHVEYSKPQGRYHMPSDGK